MDITGNSLLFWFSFFGFYFLFSIWKTPRLYSPSTFYLEVIEVMVSLSCPPASITATIATSLIAYNVFNILLTGFDKSFFYKYFITGKDCFLFFSKYEVC